MSTKFLAEDLRSIANKLNRIHEASKPVDAAKDPISTPPNNTTVGTTSANIVADTSVDDMMTHEKKPAKLVGSIAVKELAKILGITNVALFTSAFNALRSGKVPSNQTQVRELAIAFGLLLASDASTTTNVLNKLRRIHKSS